MATRKELTEAVVQRYREASKRDRSKILDEFASLTQYHRQLLIVEGMTKVAADLPFPMRFMATITARDIMEGLAVATGRVCRWRSLADSATPDQAMACRESQGSDLGSAAALSRRP